jgi:hypothetical protein
MTIPYAPVEKKITPGVLFIWNCDVCGNVLGVVKDICVQIRFKGLVAECAFPVLRYCHKCRTWNFCAGSEESLTGETKHDTLSALQTQLPRLTPKVKP